MTWNNGGTAAREQQMEQWQGTMWSSCQETADEATAGNNGGTATGEQQLEQWQGTMVEHLQESVGGMVREHLAEQDLQ